MGQHQHIYSHAFYPVLAYAMAAVGSGLGLACAARFHARGLARGWSWLGAGALTLGSGIWGMHFIAMLGFSVDGVEFRYDVPLTVVSLLVAIVIVGFGMYVAGVRRSWSGLLIGGVGAGFGVAAMHYMGMEAMLFPGKVDYTTWLVVLSVVIAVVAATVALWFTLRVTGTWATIGAALVMAVAISGMHYTGMAAVNVRDVSGVHSDSGVTGLVLVAPLIIGLGLELMLITFAVLMSPVQEVRGRTAVPVDPAEEFRVAGRYGVPASPPAASATHPGSLSGPVAPDAFGGAQGDPYRDSREFGG
ncbi:MHYT domain-containing protein [Streptomyces sp. MI02-7b]|uniref:MHYT domain-containing protein n=1 Tax=Streptomyces sp. MI02-7b TaxID=462941 RepID=UPI0029B32951|nr:MHYT domain-containing protein [Streptomyces sp. MI02-7b]MDX3072946.1 MHYT domain-containing protein [Streptomyces sp. MI02-7b]